jgi:asparagine synthetase B (glutamine-hydrolysing)
MCGFLVHNGAGDNSRIRRRGPDATNIVERAGLTFVHNLLSITGSFTLQPFVDDEIVCLYNGQIYNQPFTRTDGEVLIPLYRKLGPSFATQLDGEFALALYDFGNEIALFATDPFKTKPLFINGIQCASYRSGVGGVKAVPNEIVVKKFDGTIVDRRAVRRWDLTQWKETYDDWIAAFERAVAKRSKPGCFIGLSSGYDSGALACALGRKGVEFKAYIYASDEHQAVLDARKALVPHEEFLPNFSLVAWLRDHVDNEPYTIVCDQGVVSTRVLDDGATLGMATIAQLARAAGRRVALSGQGADEILSDYSAWPDQSELKGWFPGVLRLWRNFNYSCQESYLMKEEYAGGAFGIESRYPYLDADLVQEFLWLSSDAKNRHYKAPLREYLLRHDFPFEEGVKRGFWIDMARRECPDQPSAC